MHRDNWTREPQPGELDPTRELYEQQNANQPARSTSQQHPHAMEPDTTEPENLTVFDADSYLSTPDSVVLTGRKRSGKTYVANNSNAEPLGFADPMEVVCEKVLGHTSRWDSDVRAFLCNLGALGRGEIPSRSMRNRVKWDVLGRRLQRDGAQVTGMGGAHVWESFGTETFWIDLMESRLNERAPAGPAIIHNARFPEEVRRFTTRGFRHLHVMASEETRRARLAETGEEPSPDARTEQLARELDRVARGENPLELELAQGLFPTTLDDVRSLDTVLWSAPRNVPDAALCETGERVATSSEPTPNGEGDDVAALVQKDIEARAQEGEDTYGERLTTHNGRDALVDAYQEVLDTAMYLRQELAERG
ncbi:hypothetical protein FGG70_gp33 [Salinibacter phage M1EM-1]|uniref:Uncharacterized protein n=1 Tax=Salinibacter phage M1EM-1 TaxID=2681616 RepID=A0A2I6UFZ7_9CAUD|nr:hypothetical protein FGG70_gp33 [Salinibacter phage M1EM-1]AUO78918.1 hypothetical protein [Salinibacter phage M1EM-1]